MKHLCALLLLLLCRAASAQIILSEVMFNPRGNENAYEFIEIYNAGPTDAVSLRGWKIGDQIETDLLVSPDSLYTLAPGQFAVILDPNYFQSPAVYDSLIPAQALILTINDNSFGSGGLSNSTAETIFLLDAADKMVARYTYSLGNADGISDEKIVLDTNDAPTNWANSRRVDGTPGQRNSVLEPGYPRGVVRINEIMYAPTTGLPEWIEIFNPQPTALSLADWVLQDESNTRATVKNKATIPPLSYRVLAANPSVAAAFKIADSLVIALDNFPALNNDGDVLLLRDFSGAVIDSAAYQPNWGASGISAEKIWHERENVTANWQPSRDARGGTPAALNSVSPRDIDLAAMRLRFDPPKPRAGDDVQLHATIGNSGRRPVERFTVTFAHDRNYDNEIQSGEEIGSIAVTQSISPEDSIIVRQIWSQPPSGRQRVLVTVSAPPDAVTGNNRISALLPVGYSSRSVVMNEIYYAPRSGEAEWVEFYNRSTQPVELSSWRWRDAEADFPITLPDSALILAPGAFALLAAGRNIANAEPSANVIVPKNWLTLNNDRETLVLADFNGHVQDSLSFSQHWGGDTGFSLERINPNLASTDSSNWSGSVATTGSTPGKRNSIFTEFVPQQATITVSPQPFSPDGDGHDDFAIIQFQVPATTATAQVKIFDVRGRLVHQLLNNAPVGATHQVLWNGRDETRQLLPTGIYIVYLQAIQASGGVLVEARTTLVLARKLK